MTDDQRPGSPLLFAESFTAATVSELRHRLAAAVAAAGVSGDRAEDYVLAAHELVTNAVLHGGGAGRLELRLLDGDVLSCEIVDHGQRADGLPVRLPRPDQVGGRGLWLAHQLTGSLVLVEHADGVSGTVSICVTDVTDAMPSRPEETSVET